MILDGPVDFTEPPDDSWRERAACRDVDPSAADWFPEQHQGADRRTRQALAICATCPVRQECLRYALANDEHRCFGLWGGLGPKQRSRLRAELVRTGQLVITRTCANPACRRTFQAKPTVPRANQCCSNECRLTRRQLQQRSKRINDASIAGNASRPRA